MYVLVDVVVFYVSVEKVFDLVICSKFVVVFINNDGCICVVCFIV